MSRLTSELAELLEKARLYEEKMRKNNECAKMSYQKRLARERGMTLEEHLANPPPRKPHKPHKRGAGRPKKNVEIACMECVECV